MFDDVICSITAMDRLEQLCMSKQLVRCDTCFFAKPNAGHDVPYCTKLTKLGKGEEISVTDIGKFKPYKLKEGNIPKKCKYWKSAIKEQAKQDSARKTKEIQRAINRLRPEERKKEIKNIKGKHNVPRIKNESKRSTRHTTKNLS